MSTMKMVLGLGIVLAIVVLVVVVIISSMPITPVQPIPSEVTYHQGDPIGDSGYVFSGLYGTGADGSNTIYIIFGSPATGNVQYELIVGHTYILGDHRYTLTSYGQDTITLVELVYPLWEPA